MNNAIGVNHTAFFCRDLAAQEAFYTKHFGFKRSRTFNRGQENEFFLLKLGPTRIEFFKARGTTPPDARGGEQPVGFRHLALNVPKLEPALEALKADGVEHDPIIETPHIGPGARVVFFRDPEGNSIELMENYRDEDE